MGFCPRKKQAAGQRDGLKAVTATNGITELEGLAILHTVRTHRHFLVGNPFTVRILTGHRPLQWVHNVNTASGRLTRWMLELDGYDMRIEFDIPGRVNDVADALSRLMDSRPNEVSEGIEFRDYLREQDVMSNLTEAMMSEPTFLAEWQSAEQSIAEMHLEDGHLNGFYNH